MLHLPILMHGKFVDWWIFILYFVLLSITALLIFLLKLFQLWTLGAFLTWLHPYEISLFVTSTLPSGLLDSMGYLVYFLLRLSHFFMESYFLLLEKGIRNQDMYTGYTCSYWNVIGFRPSLAERGREYMCTC